MATTINKRIGEGAARAEIYAALAYDASDRFGGYEIKDVLHNTTYKQYFRDTNTYINSSTAGQLDLVATLVKVTGNFQITGSLTYGATAVPVATTYLGDLTVGVDGTGYDVKFYGDTAGKYWLWDESEDKMIVIGEVEVGVNDTGHDVKFFGATSGSYWLWDESADGVVLVGAQTQTGNYQLTGTLTIGVNGTGHDVNIYTDTSGSKIEVDESADALNITAVNTTMTGTLTVGVDDEGHDVKFYGDTTGKYWLWDESDDKMIIAGAFDITGNTSMVGNLACSGIVDNSNATDASNTTTAALKTAGGLAVVKKAYIGTDLVLVGKGIDMSTANTGNYNLTLKDNQADALSIVRGSTDMVVFVSTTGSPAINITPNTAITGTLTVGGVISGTATTEASATTTAALKTAGGLGVAKKAYIGTDLVLVGKGIDMSTATTGTYDLTLKDNQADALSIVRGSTDMMVFTSTTASPKITITPNTVVTGTLVSGAKIVPKSTITALTSGATATYTAAQIMGGVIVDTPGEAATCTTDTGTNIVAAIPNAVDGSTFMVTIHNAHGTNGITLAAGADVTIVGTTLTVPAKNVRTFLGVVTSVSSNTVSLYSVGSLAHTT